jgi:hypothetical protein
MRVITPDTKLRPGSPEWLATLFQLAAEQAEPDDKFGKMFAPTSEYLADRGDLDLKWVVEGLLPETYLAVIGATSNGGKSCLVTSLAIAVASGEPFLGMKTCGGAVLWVAYEESRQERGLALKAFDTLPENLYFTHEKPYIDERQGLEALRYWIKRTKAKLVVIDPLYASCVAESLSDGRTARATLTGLKDLCKEESCAAIVLHHITKDTSAGQSRERFADSNQILATASMDLLMDYTERADGSRRIWLRGRGRGDFANQTWLIDSNGIADYRLVAAGGQLKVEEEAKDRAVLSVLEASDSALSAEQIAEGLGQPVGSVRNRLTRLVTDQLVEITGKGGPSKRSALYSAARFG